MLDGGVGAMAYPKAASRLIDYVLLLDLYLLNVRPGKSWNSWIVPIDYSVDFDNGLSTNRASIPKVPYFLNSDSPSYHIQFSARTKLDTGMRRAFWIALATQRSKRFLFDCAMRWVPNAIATLVASFIVVQGFPKHVCWYMLDAI